MDLPAANVGEIQNQKACPICGNKFDIGLMTTLGPDMPIGCVICANAHLNVKAGLAGDAPHADAGVNERIDQAAEVVLADAKGQQARHSPPVV